MKVKVTFDSNGQILGFYPDSEHYQSIPDPNLEITDEQWQECIDNPGKYIVQNGQLVQTPPLSDAELLENAKASKLAQLKQSFSDTLLQGFNSTADGTSRTFGFDDLDQKHWSWIREMTNSPNPPSSIPVKDMQDNRLSLTVAQAQQLCLDAQNFYLTNYSHWNDKEQEVENATAIESVNAIAW